MLVGIDSQAVRNLKVGLFFRDFAAIKGVSHIGLGVSAANIAKTFNALGIRAEARAISVPQDLQNALAAARSAGAPFSHVVIGALWIPTAALAKCARMFPDTKFVVTCHSNVAFLSIEPNAVRLLREGAALQAELHNFSIAGNSRKFTHWMTAAYGAHCLYLPNLYYMDSGTNTAPRRTPWASRGGPIKIGMFGATRMLKNFPGGVAACVQLAQELCADVQIWVNSGREDGPKSLLDTARRMVEGLPNASLHFFPWAPWPVFRTWVGGMDVGCMPSFTESFNMVTADAVHQGVPSAVGSAVSWTPPEWQCDADSTVSIVRTLVALLHDPHAARRGEEALRAHNQEGIAAWMQWLIGLRMVYSVGVES